MTKNFEEKYASIKHSKEMFIEDFLQYLRTGNEKIPIDIINSKISEIDYLYVPFFIYQVSGRIKVNARIGKNHTEYDTQETGRTKISYEKDFWGNHYRIEEAEKELIAREYTDWETQNFSLINKKEKFKICANSHISSFIKKKISYGFNFSDVSERNENFKKLKFDVNIDKIQKYKKEIEKELKSDAKYKLSQMGDKQENIKISDVELFEKTLYLWIPVGYIKYNYNTNQDYYFIESLFDKKVIFSSIPEDTQFLSKNSEGCGTSLLFLVLYSTFIYFIYKLIKMINLPYLDALFAIFVTIFVVDYFSIVRCYTSISQNNVDKRKNYIDKIFQEHQDEVKNLIIGLNKPYKD